MYYVIHFVRLNKPLCSYKFYWVIDTALYVNFYHRTLFLLIKEILVFAYFIYMDRITELYLQNNDICDITGALSHLPCLRVLMLQKNQLPDLYGTLHEIKSLLSLEIVSK